MSSARSIPFGRPWITAGDRAAVAEVLCGSQLTHGPQGAAFEAEFATFIGSEARCVSVSSCMAALHLACLQMGIGPGDDVLVPALTHVATAQAVELVGARPVFVDCDASGNVTAAGLAVALTPQTKALCVVHFAGIPCNMTDIMQWARQQGLKVVEDCALALGALHARRHVGLWGDVGCFSFYPVKHITTGEGGMLVTRDSQLTTDAARRRAFGIDRDHTQRGPAGGYDVVMLGLNYRLSEMQAALGRCQLRRLEEMLARRRENFHALRDAVNKLAEVRVLDTTTAEDLNSHYCLVVELTGKLGARRDAVAAEFRAAGIGVSVYYPHPVPRMQYFREKYGYDPASFPRAEAISDRSLALPVGPHVEAEDLTYMTMQVRQILSRSRA